MTDIRFYHMQQKTLEQALPEILSKALERQYRIVVKASSQERVEFLNACLWTYDAASFLPHGSNKDGFEAEHPIWLTTVDENPNQANMLVLVDSTESDHINTVDLCCEFFDGNDEDAVAAARQRWKNYKEQGHALTYFQQDDAGKWQKKA